MAITPITPLTPPSSVQGVQALRPAEKPDGAFGKMIGEFSKDFNQIQDQASLEVNKLAAGNVDNVHQVMLALGKSEIAFNYMLEVRNRVLDSYKEVMRMPL